MQRDIKIPTDDLNKSDYESFIIVADVGGTHTTIAIAGIRNSTSFDIILKHIYPTKDITAFETVLNDTLQKAKEEYDIEISKACIGAAGPVLGNREYVKLTNADLEINTSEILNRTMLNKIILLNDFEVIGYSLDLLDLNEDVMKLPHLEEDLKENSTTSNFAVMGAGTGLGMCITPYDAEKQLHIPFPSEGGHIEFAPNNRLEMKLAKFIKKRGYQKDLHPDMESVVSGKGIETIYDFLMSLQLFKTKITKQISLLEEDEKLAEIEANYERDKTCKKTIDMFITFYARAAKNLALMSKCYGGLFIAGNISLKNIEFLKDRKFMQEFEEHNKRPDILKKIPVYVIINRDVSLYGCCNAAINFFS